MINNQQQKNDNNLNKSNKTSSKSKNLSEISDNEFDQHIEKLKNKNSLFLKTINAIKSKVEDFLRRTKEFISELGITPKLEKTLKKSKQEIKISKSEQEEVRKLSAKDNKTQNKRVGFIHKANTQIDLIERESNKFSKVITLAKADLTELQGINSTPLRDRASRLQKAISEFDEREESINNLRKKLEDGKGELDNISRTMKQVRDTVANLASLSSNNSISNSLQSRMSEEVKGGNLSPTNTPINRSHPAMQKEQRRNKNFQDPSTISNRKKP